MATQQPQLTIRDHREKDWFWANNGIIDWYGEIIGADSVAVYAALCRHASANGECWPSYKTIAGRVKLSRPTVIKAMKKLEAAGLIAKTERDRPTQDGGTMPDSNMYVLLTVQVLDEPSKGALLGVVKGIDHPVKKEGLPRQKAKKVANEKSAPSKGDLPGVVKELYPPSKGALPKEDSLNKTQLNKRERGAERHTTRTPKPEKERDETLDHLAVSTYRATFKRWPTAEQRQAIIVAVTDNEHWSDVCALWKANRWDYLKVENLISRYQKGNTNGKHVRSGAGHHSERGVIREADPDKPF